MTPEERQRIRVDLRAHANAECRCHPGDPPCALIAAAPEAIRALLEWGEEMERQSRAWMEKWKHEVQQSNSTLRDCLRERDEARAEVERLGKRLAQRRSWDLETPQYVAVLEKVSKERDEARAEVERLRGHCECGLEIFCPGCMRGMGM